MRKEYEKRKISKGDIIKRYYINNPDEFVLLLVLKENSERIREYTSSGRYTVRLLKKHYTSKVLQVSNDDQETGEIWSDFEVNGHPSWNDVKLSLEEAVLEVL